MPLVAWWKLDALVGGEFVDYGPYKLSSTNNGVTVDNAGIVGPCGSFNGTSDYIEIDAIMPYIVDRSYSAFAWVKADTQTTGDAIIAINSSSGGTNTMMQLTATGGVVRMYIDAAQTPGTISINDGDWYHYGYTVDVEEGVTRQYVNGRLDQTFNTVPSLATSNIVAIGAEYDASGGPIASNWWDGFIADVRFYDHALSKKEIKELAQAKVVHFRFSEDRNVNGLIVTDSSDYGNHADAFGASNRPTWSNIAPGQGGGYYTFDASDTISFTPNFEGRADLDVAWTLAAWVKTTDTATNQRLVDNLHADQYLVLSTNKIATMRLTLFTYYRNSVDLTDILYDDVWHQVVFTFDNRVSEMHIYVDGVNVDGVSAGNNGISLTSSASSWSIGNTVQCSIADFRFYNTPLSPEDVLELYQAGMQVDDKGNVWC